MVNLPETTPLTESPMPMAPPLGASLHTHLPPGLGYTGQVHDLITAER